MLASPFTAGVGIYAFYALQPYLLELVGDPTAYGIAGVTAALVAGAQIVGGIAAPRIRRLFRLRTSALLVRGRLGARWSCWRSASRRDFWAVIGLVAIWAMLFAASMPIRQSYLNGMIPSAQRATILSFDSMLGSSGGVAFQPALGRAADVWGYGTSYVIGAAISALALPFIALSRTRKAPADEGATRRSRVSRTS